MLRDLNKEYRTFLENEFTYYQGLDQKNKRLFRRRLQKFILQKEFVACGEFSGISPRMKALIGASAVQLTFGLPGIYLQHFTRIFVYPDTYFSSSTQRMHKGEVNMRGAIVLSWKDFLEGYRVGDDGVNLGLHEMAHALKVEDMISNSEYDFLDGHTLRRFIGYTRKESAKILSGEPSFFRSYAATNDHEFFAVVMENFFERPKLFKELHRELYYLTSRLLNQDVLRMQSVPVAQRA